MEKLSSRLFGGILKHERVIPITINNEGKMLFLKFMLSDFRVNIFLLNNFKVLIAWRETGKEYESLQVKINSNDHRVEGNLKLCFILIT